jgi:hypothetical protein
MGVEWENTLEVLARLLRERGQDPERVTSVEAAWQAFRSFLACPVDGLEPGPDSDADGFVVQWGRSSWNDKRPSLTFTRLFEVDVRATWTEPGWYQPESWKAELELVFDHEPALAGIHRLGVRNTAFDFSPPGPGRERALREVDEAIQRYPTLRALWTSTPARSSLHLHYSD